MRFQMYGIFNALFINYKYKAKKKGLDCNEILWLFYLPAGGCAMTERSEKRKAKRPI